MKRGHGGSSTLVLAGSLLLAGCGPARIAEERGTLTLAVRADVTGFFPNPPGVNEAYTSSINQSIFEGPVGFDRQLRIVPTLAERWENSDDQTYLFVVRRGLRFSDGRPVSARDVAASLEAALRHGWETRDYLRAIRSARALDDRHVEVRTHGPSLSLLTRLPWGFVLPADAVDRQPAPAVGTGPYLLESWTRGREFVLARNPYFRGPAPAFGRVRFVVMPESAARIAAVTDGTAALASDVPPEALAGLRARRDLRVVSRPSLMALFLCFRVDSPPFSDPRLREAVDVALDRAELIRRALAGQGEPAAQIVPPAVVGHDPGLAVAPLDRERARRLLAEAGYPRGLSVRLDGPSNRYVNDRLILAEVARQLGEIGVRVEVNAQDKLAFFELIDGGGSQMHLLGWACLSGDAGDVLESLTHSPTDGFLGAWNTLGLEDPELDRLIDAGYHSRTSAGRTRHLRAAVARLAVTRPIVPLVFPREALVMSRSLDWEPGLDLALRPAEMRPARAAGP